MDVTKAIQPAIAARFKLLAGLNIDEHYRPAGRPISAIRSATETIDVRVSVIPTFYGEKVEMRLLAVVSEAAFARGTRHVAG